MRSGRPRRNAFSLSSIPFLQPSSLYARLAIRASVSRLMNAMTNAKAPASPYKAEEQYEEQDECSQMGEPHAASRPSEMYDKRDCRENTYGRDHHHRIRNIAFRNDGPDKTDAERAQENRQ